MKKRVRRVALPSVSTSSPVASGSSVPVWPTRFCRRTRRTFCTASCEVIPASLSISKRPCCIRRLSAPRGGGAERCLERRGDRLAQGAQLPLDLEARGVLVPAAPVLARQLLDVHLAAAAQRYLVAVGAGLAEERHGFDASDRARVVHEALGVARGGAAAREHLLADHRRRHPAVVVQLE